ncbi:MAG: type II toxin-antitoxin system VapC family toxin [Dehalococcoidia bacterium]
MTYVLDASAAAAFVLPDEVPSDDLAASLANDDAIVPANWPAEVVNTVLSARRSRRIGAEECAALLASIAGFAVALEPPSMERTAGPVATLAQERALTVYDAAYLELAIRRGVPLATLDAALARAAREASIAVIE